MTKRKGPLTLPSNQKRYTSPLGDGFRCLDESYDEGPSSKCETAYDSHKKPSEFNSSNFSFRKKPDVNATSSVKPSMAKPQVNLGLSSLPKPEWINPRKRANIPMCPLVQEEPTPDVSAHLKEPPVNPHKKSILPLPVGAALAKNNKKEKDETVTDPDYTMTQPSKRKKTYVSTLPRNYRRRPLSLHSSTKSKENSKKNASKMGTAEYPVCLDADDCIIEDIQQTNNPSQPSPSLLSLSQPSLSQPSPSQPSPSLQSSAICTRSKVPTLSNPTEWDNIDLLRYISQIYFSHLDLTPLNVEITSSELTISVEHKDENATLTIRYNELDCIEMSLTGKQPHLMIFHMRTDHFNKYRKLLMSKLNLHKFWYSTDNYVVLIFDNKLDAITIQHIEEKFPTHIRVLKLELHQVDEFLQNRETKRKERKNEVDSDNEEPLPIVRRFTRSQLTSPSRPKKSPSPTLFISSVPQLSIPDDEIVLTHQFKHNNIVLSITGADMRCLQDGEYLNDNIINFYLMYLWDSLNEKWEDVHIFNSFFYSQLTNGKLNYSSNDLNTPERFHVRVKSWTKKINIFDKKLTVIPINYRHHWYLAVVMCPNDFDPEALPVKKNISSASKRKTTAKKGKKKSKKASTTEKTTEDMIVDEDSMEVKLHEEIVLSQDTEENGDSHQDDVSTITDTDHLITDSNQLITDYDQLTTDSDQLIADADQLTTVTADSNQLAIDSNQMFTDSDQPITVSNQVITDFVQMFTDSDPVVINLDQDDVSKLSNDSATIIDDKSTLTTTTSNDATIHIHDNNNSRSIIDELLPMDDSGSLEQQDTSIVELQISDNNSSMDEVLSMNESQQDTSMESVPVDSLTKDQPAAIMPGILILDSMLVRRRTTGAHLQKYLSQEHLRKYELVKDFSKLPVRFPSAPGQTNGYDCGVYLLTYTESLLQCFKDNRLPSENEWALPETIADKRRTIFDLIRNLSKSNIS